MQHAIHTSTLATSYILVKPIHPPHNHPQPLPRNTPFTHQINHNSHFCKTYPFTSQPYNTPLTNYILLSTTSYILSKTTIREHTIHTLIHPIHNYNQIIHHSQITFHLPHPCTSIYFTRTQPQPRTAVRVARAAFSLESSS